MSLHPCIRLLLLLLFFFLSTTVLARRPLPYASNVSTDPTAIAAASTDFGLIVKASPAEVLQPSSPADVAALVLSSYTSGKPFTIGARGNGHSTHGQSLVGNGVVVNMTAMGAARGRIKVDPQNLYVDAGGEQLWVDVLRATLKNGLAPKSWTDYLYLTVGGTLSNAGISGQAFRVGPQISNVYELDVITGKGELITCSKRQNSDLFYAVLGGLGQFGIITRARIALEQAPQRARWLHLSYDDVAAFTKDQVHLISIQANGFDYIEGLVVPNNGSLVYSLEATKYYNDPSQLDAELKVLLYGLSYKQGGLTFNDTSYFDFLNRVFKEEQTLRAAGLWFVPHPWLNIFIPRSRISEFDAGVFRGVAMDDLATGPIIIYPMNRNKWYDNRWYDKTSAVTPDAEEVFYLIGILKSAVNDPQKAEEQNAKILDFLKSAGIQYKLYLANYQTRSDWERHFGSKWSAFSAMKTKYDPLKILSPGQKIFN